MIEEGQVLVCKRRRRVVVVVVLCIVIIIIIIISNNFNNISHSGIMGREKIIIIAITLENNMLLRLRYVLKKK